MNRRWIALNLVLIALAVSLAWLLRQHWLEAQAHERAIFEQAARKKNVLPPPPLTPPKPVTPAEYIDVASRMLFAADRNPNVIVDPPKPAPPPPPMPPLPSYFGQMGFTPPTVLLSTQTLAQKSYHAGDTIGPFEIVRFDHEKIAFKWNDQTVEKKLEEITPKEAPPELTQPVAARPQQSQASQAKSLGDSGSKPDSQVGAEISGSDFHACVPGDTSPAGTVVGNYKKVMTRGLMGMSCQWESVSK
jgi:cell division septation protein DedD